MSGKHDRSLDDEQSAKLLVTGPIVIRGLGRSVKDALRPGSPSRHRAVAGDDGETEEPTPVQAMLTLGSSVPEAGSSSPVTDVPITQDDSVGDDAFPEDAAVPQTGVPDGPREDRVDECQDDTAPGDDAPQDGSSSVAPEEQPEVEVAVEHDESASASGLQQGPDVPGTPADASPRDVDVEAAPSAEQDQILPDPFDAPAEEDAEALPQDAGVSSYDEVAQLPENEAPGVGDPLDESSAGEPAVSDAVPEGALAAYVDPDGSTISTSALVDAEEHEELDADALERDIAATDDEELDAAAAELLSPDAATEDAATATPVQDPIVTQFIGDRGWTIAEELFSRPVTVSTRGDADASPDGEAVGERETTDASTQSRAMLGDEPGAAGPEPEHDDAHGVDGESEGDPFGEAFLVPDELDAPGALTAEVATNAEPADAQADGSDEEADPGEGDFANESVADSATASGPDAPPIDGEPGAASVTTQSAGSMQSDADADADADADRAVTDAFLAELAEPETHPAADAGAAPSVRSPAAKNEPSKATPAAPALVTAAASASAGTAPPARPSAVRSGGSVRPPQGPRPIRERFDREAIGIAVLVVLALVCGGLITAVVLKTQRDAAIAASQAANYTPPPLATPSTMATGPAIAVIGDGTTSTAADGVATSQKWSALLASSLDATVTTDASSGMGYAAKGGSGETFVQAAAKVPSNAEVVIVFGGAADSDVQLLSLAKAATDTFSAVQKQAPDAKLIVVGPAIGGGVSEADLTLIRNTLHGAAAIAKATWVDPIDQDWLSSTKQDASSPTALTVANEKQIASKMESAVKKALG